MKTTFTNDDDYDDDWEDCIGGEDDPVVAPEWVPKRKLSARQRYDNFVAEKRLRQQLEDDISHQ